MKDTHHIVTSKDKATLETGETSSHEILDVVVLTLSQNPDRSDLWMMRFEIQRTIGLKADFIQAMRDGYSNPRFRRFIDWSKVREMWDELAPGEDPPEDVKLPSAKKQTQTQATVQRTRRFSDLAQQIAGAKLAQLSTDYQALRASPKFFLELAAGTRKALHRPTPLHHAQALQNALGTDTRIFLKREDQHDNTPEMEVAAAQAQLAVMMGKKHLITGNDVDGFSLAVAQIAPSFGLSATIVLRPAEIEQKTNLVDQLRGLNAQVEVMDSGCLGEDPREGALLRWLKAGEECQLVLSFGTGPNPFPRIISDFQMLLGYESELQLRTQGGAGRARTLIAAVHSAADSIGFVLPYLKRSDIALFYAEPDPRESKKWTPSERLLAYNGARREHSWLRATGRITHIPISEAQARDMQALVEKLEQCSISLEDARAVTLATGLIKGETGDRDMVVLVG